MSGAVTLEQTGALATVTLSHAGKFNAMSRQMWRELRRIFEALQNNAEVRCVLVRGADAHFCAGGDISEYTGFRFDPATLQDFHENDVWGGLQAMLACDLPMLAQIEGNCMGAGLEMASCCDLRLAAESARFGAPIARLGFPMAPREAALVLGAVGELTAREMLLSAQVLGGPEMKQRGFLNQVLPDAELAGAVRERLTRMAQLAPQAARLNKASFRALGPINRAQAAIELIASESPYAYADSAEHREGINAFLEKRVPQF